MTTKSDPRFDTAVVAMIELAAKGLRLPFRHNAPVILDVGAGDGKLSDYLNRNRFCLAAVEIFEPYVSQFKLKDRYHRVFLQDARTLKQEIFDSSDIVVFGDVLEHMTAQEARELIDRVPSMILAQVPFLYEQGPVNGNQWETHLQPDLTPAIMKERYPSLRPVIVDERLGLYWRPPL